MFKKIITMQRKVIILVSLLIVSFNCWAWGPTGHRVTGWIAEKHLTKKARSVLKKILKGQSLAIASTWMDEVRSDSTYDYMTDWHWVRIPDSSSYEQSVKNPNGDIIMTIERIVSELKSRNLSPDAEAERIKILIHLVGDIHQPLHVSVLDDRGGNDVQVMWFGQNSNLHRVWDSDIIDHTRLSYTEMAESFGKPTASEVRSWQQATVYDWARESQSYLPQVYEYDNGRLGYEYAYVNYPSVRHRLVRAGVRLAGILNDIYG